MYRYISKGWPTNLIAFLNSRVHEILNDFHDHSLSGHLGVDKTLLIYFCF